nr:response regulator [Rhodopirellula sp. JC639]
MMFDGRQQIVNSKILVIDDEQIIIDVITAHLNVAGFWNVVGISDSIDAVQRMKQENPDLVLLDISMPDVSGNYLIQIARADPNLNTVPLIVVTASDSEDIHRRALELGADEVLTKPLQPGVLVKRVEHALGRKLESDVSSLNQRQQRCKPANEKYNELRGLGGRIL